MGEPELRKIEPLNESRQQLAEVRRNVWRIHVANGTSPKDILSPAYWVHVARSYRMFDKIEALAEDGSWYMELLVVDCGQGFAKVAAINGTLTELSPVEPESRATPLAGHSVMWAGIHAKWRVVRDADKKTIREGFAHKADAFVWLDGYGKSLAA